MQLLKMMLQKMKKWLFEKDFNNAQEFDDFLKTENTWVKGKKSTTKSGVKQYYRCDYVTQRAKKQCNAGLFTISDFEPNNPKVRLFRKKSGHNHHELQETSKKVNAEKVGEIRKQIGQMYENRLKPTTIRHTLRKMDDIEQKD